MKQLLTKSFLFAFLLLGGMVMAQTPFWTQDFAGGIPAGWTNTDGSNQGALWTWCNNPASGQGGCPSIFDDGLNQQVPFQATTAANGFVTLDSDEYGPFNTNHISRLTTSAINCSGKSEVFVSFETHIGVFEVSAETGAILRVSTDNVTWTNYTIFPGLTTAVRWSDNPATPIINISATSANSATVYIRWEWTGNWEYHWSIDDVKLYDANPTPPNDIAIGDFFYAPSSLAQPVSQIATDTFGFGADLSNRGTVDQTNVILRASVTTDTNDELWADSILIPVLAAGVADSFFSLPGRYAPELPIGSYRIKYSVRADSADMRPIDNNKESPFLVTASIFSKEVAAEQAFRPGGNPSDWYIGNLYTMSAGSLDQYQASTAQFTFTTNAADLPVTDVEATIFLLRVADDVDFNVAGGFNGADFLSPDLEWLGVAAYSAPDTMVGGLLQAVNIVDLNSGLDGVLLDNGARYILAIGYSGSSSVAFHGFNDDVKMFFVSTLTYSTQWFTGGFGPEFNAVLRMTISLVSTTDDKALPETSMKIFPNPVRDAVNLAVNFEQPTDATITIADMSGRVILIQDRQGLTQENLTYQIPQLAAGTYLARIATAEGTLTKKFIVQK